jgi:hypothetical protein
MSHARRDEILTRYGLPPGEHPDYEIDHLIPLCLGGSDDPSNLWPEPRGTIEPKWNAEAKDRLERRICVWFAAGNSKLVPPRKPSQRIGSPRTTNTTRLTELRFGTSQGRRSAAKLLTEDEAADRGEYCQAAGAVAARAIVFQFPQPQKVA